jgi:hypothetical protein
MRQLRDTRRWAVSGLLTGNMGYRTSTVETSVAAQAPNPPAKQLITNALWM